MRLWCSVFAHPKTPTMRLPRLTSRAIVLLLTSTSLVTGCYSRHPIQGLATEEQLVRIQHPEGFVLWQPKTDPNSPWIRCRATTAVGRVVNSTADTLRLVGLNSVKWVGDNPGCGNSSEFRIVYADAPDARVERMRFRPGRTFGVVLVTLYALGHLFLTLGSGSGGLS